MVRNQPTKLASHRSSDQQRASAREVKSMSTDASTPAENAARKQRGRLIEPGQSGIPAGKPPGTRHRSTLAAAALLEGEAEKLTRKAIDLALAGDVQCLHMCLDRVASVPRERAAVVEPPATGRGAASHHAALAAVSEGTIGPEQGEAISRLIEATATAAAAIPLPRSPEQKRRDAEISALLSGTLTLK
jgi:hypothetical protein